MYDPAKREIKLGKKEGKRFKKLGDFGELLAGDALKQNGFENIVNLNDFQYNFPFADYYATKDKKCYIISVKTRNKYERSGKLNQRYKLGKAIDKLNMIFESVQYEKYHDCEPAFLTIAMEDTTFDAYFGLIKDLPNKRGIRMSNKAKLNYLCLAENMPHFFDSMEFKNIYNK
ncbi:MAG: hypothetical protein ACOCQ4_01890 [bacterium]